MIFAVLESEIWRVFGWSDLQVKLFAFIKTSQFPVNKVEKLKIEWKSKLNRFLGVLETLPIGIESGD